MERLPDPIHWKRRRSTEDWRVSSRPHIYFYSSDLLVPDVISPQAAGIVQEQSVSFALNKVEEHQYTTLFHYENM